MLLVPMISFALLVWDSAEFIRRWLLFERGRNNIDIDRVERLFLEA